MSQGWAKDRPAGPWHDRDRGGRGRDVDARTKLPPPATHALPPPPPGASGAIEFRSPNPNPHTNPHHNPATNGGAHAAERNGSGAGAREPGELSIRGRAASPPPKPLLDRLSGPLQGSQGHSSQSSQSSQPQPSSQDPPPRRARSPNASGPSSYRPDDSGPSRPPPYGDRGERFPRDSPYGRRDDRHEPRRERDRDHRDRNDRRRSRSPMRDHREHREPREPPRYGDRQHDRESRYDGRRDDRREDRYGGPGRYGDDYGRRQQYRPDDRRRDTRDMRPRDPRDARDARDSRDGYDSYRPQSPRDAGSTGTRRSHDRRSPHRSSPFRKDVEEGEIDGAEEGEVAPAPSHTGQAAPKAEEGPHRPSPLYKSSMQPREPSNPPPPPPDDAPPPPDAPPPSVPPPPTSGSPRAKSPAPPPVPSKSGGQSPKPRPIDSAYRPQSQKSGNHAPNRNLVEPVTRVSTPIARDMLKEQPRRLFRFPTAEDEKKAYNREFIGTTTLAAYDVGIKLGEGTFGVVTKAVELASRKPVALKKLIIHNQRDGVSVTTVREIKILKELNHPNIVPLIDMVVQRKVPSDRSERGEVFMVFPFMDHDLCGLLLNKDFRMTHSVSKLLFRQILEGVDFMHVNNIIHRDLKTANILVSKEGHVMIADFGLARTIGIEPMPKHSPHEYTNMVVTRWYRAPELLLGDCHYTTAIDLWSLGCILGEMYHHDPIFPGESEQNQLYRIFNRLGPPNQIVWPDWDKLPGMPEASGQRWDQTPRGGKSLLQCAKEWQMDRVGADLLIQLLQLNPAKRPTASEALNHPWFSLDPLPAKLGSIPVVESSHEMTSRERNPPAPVPAYQRQPSQPAGAPSWVGGGPPRPPPPVHHRQGRPPPHMGPGRGYGGPPQPYRPPPPISLPNAPAYPPAASTGLDGMGIGHRGRGGHNAPAPPFRGPGRPPGGGPGIPGGIFRLAGGMTASSGPSFGAGSGRPPPKRPAADDAWRADKRPRRDDSLPY